MYLGHYHVAGFVLVGLVVFFQSIAHQCPQQTATSLNRLSQKSHCRHRYCSHCWLSFLEMTDPLVQNIDARHAKNGLDYLSSTYDMLPGLMAYDNHDYGRWLPDYWAMLSSLSNEEMAFFNDHFSQSMTGLPYSCQPLDLWIETTMNLNSKLKQGWLQLLQNEKQLFSTTRNANNVARIKAAVKQNLKCQRRNRRHVECQPARMKKDEQAV